MTKLSICVQMEMYIIKVQQTSFHSNKILLFSAAYRWSSLPLSGKGHHGSNFNRFNRCTARNSSRANRYPNRKTRGSGNFTFPTSHSLRNHSMGTALFDHQASASGLYNQEGVKAFLGVKVLLDRLDYVR